MDTSRLATRPRIGRFLAAATLLLVGACGEGFSGPTTASSGIPPETPSGPTTPPSDTSKSPVPAKIDYIYLADADGTVRGQLTEGIWPSWSPDGRRLVFMRNGRIRVIDADGSNEKDLAAGAWPAWSPDGSRIAFVAGGALHVVSPDGSWVQLLLTPTVHILSPLETGVGFPAWSPDGAFLAFETLSIDDNAKIVIVSADGTGEHRLTRSSESELVDEDGPAWSPDGSQITYWRLDWITDSRSKDAGLTTVDRSGGDQRRLDVGGVFASFASRPTWLPDGRSIAFTLNGSVVTVPSTGGAVRTLILDGMHAAWSPDGKRIAFVRTVER